MIIKRVIPVLLMVDKGLYKTTRFQKQSYVGDPLNAVKIFNEKEVDELIFLDIFATKNKENPNYEYLKQIATECFMPLTYGGGVNNIEQIRQLNACGIEKIAINSAAITNPTFIQEAANAFGSSTIVVSVDVKKDIWGRYMVFSNNGKKNTGIPVLEHVKKIEELEAGEIMLTFIDHEGTYKGYDLTLIKMVSNHVNIPVIAHGGASSIEDFGKAMNVGASAVAAGNLFVYKGPHKAVLINYPDRISLSSILQTK